MSEGDHGLHHAVAPGVTRDETRNTFDEAGSSSEAKRWHSTVRSREYRRRKKLGLQTRTIRVAPKQVTKLIELGHNPPPSHTVCRCVVGRHSARASSSRRQAVSPDSGGKVVRDFGASRVARKSQAPSTVPASVRPSTCHRKGTVGARRLVPNLDAGCDLAIHQPLKQPDRARNTVACEP